MSTGLALPRPDNMRVPYGDAAHLVENDVYNICARIKELDPNLYLYLLDPPIVLGDKTYRYTVSEMCEDRVERLVSRFEDLDARIIEHLQYLLHVPFEHRMAEAEKLEARAEEDRKENDLAELYESMGRPMWTDLEKCGFIQRNRSYAKRGVRR